MADSQNLKSRSVAALVLNTTGSDQHLVFANDAFTAYVGSASDDIRTSVDIYMESCQTSFAGESSFSSGCLLDEKKSRRATPMATMPRMMKTHSACRAAVTSWA